jgi:hypothetical protein
MEKKIEKGSCKMEKGGWKKGKRRFSSLFFLSYGSKFGLYFSFLLLSFSFYSFSSVFATWFGLEDCSSNANVNTGYADAMRFQAPENGTSNRVEIRSYGPGGSTVRFAVYDDASGHPNNKLWEGTDITYGINTWLGENVTTIQITQNAYYWLAFKVSATVGMCYVAGGPSGSHEWKSGQPYANPFPDPWGNYSGSNNNRWTMRMHYTPEGEEEGSPRRRKIIIIGEFLDSNPLAVWGLKSEGGAK